MNRPLTDDELLAVLGGVLDTDEPLPDHVVQAAYAAPSVARLDDDLAALVFDSGRELVGMRATEAETRLLSFVNDHVTIDVELHADGRTVVGQITPAGDQTITVEFDHDAEHSVEANVDDAGRFRVSVARWPVRLRVTGRGVTPWISH